MRRFGIVGRQSLARRRSWPRSWLPSCPGGSDPAPPPSLSPLTSIPAVPAWMPGTGSPGTPGRSSIEAILNPASGPGTTQDPNYVAVVNKLRTAGGSVFGYVSTQYGNRDMTAVMNDIDKYILFYNINGIFIDEMASNQEKLPYYEKFTNISKQFDSDFKVIGNPGMPYTLEGYLASG